MEISKLKTKAEIIKENCGCKLCAVVKANAYGLGVSGVVHALSGVCKYFAVATEKEAEEVKNLCKQEILLLCFPQNLQRAIENEICFLVTNTEQAMLVANENFKKKPKAFVKFNCGMNRLGFDKFHKLGFEPYGILTHFYTNKSKILKKQVAKFQKFCTNFSPQIPVSCKASSTIKSNIRCDIARVGYELYADSVVLKSKIVEIRQLKRGEYLGYGDKKIKKATRIAVVSCGYGDGLFRSISGKYSVKINSQSCKIVHSICMDYLFCDIANLDAKIGDEVTIIENADDLQKMAKAAGTIGYEVLTAFSGRLDRIYID